MTLDITRYMVDTLRNDAAYRALTGATSKDPRVYPYYEGSATIDPSTGRYGYITYALTADPERLAATGAPVFSIAVWADTDVRAQQMAARVDALFNCEGDPDRVVTTADRTYQ